MADPVSRPPFPRPKDFMENVNKFPAEELWKYVKQFIAWSWDGTRIVAAAPTEAELYRLMDERGIDSEHVVVDYVEDPSVSIIGGTCAFDSDE